MIRCLVVVLAFASLAWRGGLAQAQVDDVSYFRRDGGMWGDASRLPANLTEDAKLVWRREVLPGNSSPCVCRDAIFLTTWDRDSQQLATVCLNRGDGSLRWTRAAPAEKIEPFHSVGSPAAPSPACDGERLFVFFGSCGLLCYDLDGQLLWRKPLGPFQDEFGAASSPVIAGNLVVLNEDHDRNSFIMAWDRGTGDEVWKTAREEATRSYATPLVWSQGGVTQILVAGSLQLTAYDAASGQRAWWVNGLSRLVDSTPTIHDGTIYLATWSQGGDADARLSMELFSDVVKSTDKDGDGAIVRTELPEASPVLERFFRIDTNQDQKLDAAEWDRHRRVLDRAENAAMAITPQGLGDVTDTSIRWKAFRGLPTVPSSVVYRNAMYMVKDSGVMTSLDLQSGQVLQQERLKGRGNYYASLVAGDGKVYACSEQGEMTIVKAGQPFEILATHDFAERIMATPVRCGQFMLVRTDAALYCYATSAAE